MKFDFLTTTSDEKSAGKVSSDYVAGRLLNRSIGSVNIADSGSFIALGLSDGSKIKFRIGASTAEVVYYLPKK